jgi:hypothetical protein
MKLCVDHPEVITTLATNPTLAYNMTRDNNFVQNLCNNETTAQQFGADANAVAAQYGYGTEVQGGMGFVQQTASGSGGGSASGGTTARMVYDANGTAYLLDANNRPMEGVQVYYDANQNPLYYDANGNPITVEDGQGGVQGVQGAQGGNAVPPEQYAQFMAAGFETNQQQIDALNAQLSKMKEGDPNYARISQEIRDLQFEQDTCFKPAMQKYYQSLNNDYQGLMQKMANGTATEQDYMNFVNLKQTMGALRQSPYYDQIAAPANNVAGNYTQMMMGNNGNGTNSYLDVFKTGMNTGYNGPGKGVYTPEYQNQLAQQQQQGQTNGALAGGQVGAVANNATTATNGQQQRTTQASTQQQQTAQPRQAATRQQPRQQRPVAQQRQPRQPAQRPAVVDTGATNQATQQPAAPAQPATPVQAQTPQAPTNRVMNPQGGAGQPQPQPQGQPQPQAQPGQPTVATHGAGGQQGQPNPQQVPGRTIQAGALNTTPNRYVAGYNPNFKPNNMQVRPMQVPQYPYQQQRR